MNPHLQPADGYARWKEERRQFHLNLYGGNAHIADRMLAFDILDTDYFLPMGTAQAALDRFKGSGPANGRQDITEFKQKCWEHRAALSGMFLNDVARYHIEAVFNAVEALSETEE